MGMTAVSNHQGKNIFIVLNLNTVSPTFNEILTEKNILIKVINKSRPLFWNTIVH